MNSFPCYSNNASIPLWLTIDEALEVVNRQTGVNIMVSEGGDALGGWMSLQLHSSLTQRSCLRE